MSKIEVDAIDKQSGSTLTLGGSGTAVTLACGATQSGFGREGSVNWQTGSLKTSTFTAVSGEGYFINSGSAITVNLPAGSAGAIVAFSDYARNFATYNLTISPNGSEKIGGIADNATLNVDGQAATFVYVDSTKGWINVQNAEDTETAASFISATGGTETTVCTNFKVHTFTGPGTFTINSVATSAPFNVVDYLVVAGGASGGKGNSAGAGGGGAGGLRVSPGTSTGCWTASPLGASPAVALPVTATGYPITVGAGGAGMPCNGQNGNPGSNSVFAGSSTITSAGGGGGAGHCQAAESGGSGGGGNPLTAPTRPAGSGNTPPVSPPQGNPGGVGNPNVGGTYPSGGGGGALAAGVGSGTPPDGQPGRAGGAGAQVNICGNNYFWAGGGGGTAWSGSTSGNGGSGGGGGAGASPPNGTGGTGSTTGINNGGNGTLSPNFSGGAGGANTGGGGGGANSPGTSGTGGSGVVIIRYRFQA